jgi:hypothetical protein
MALQGLDRPHYILAGGSPFSPRHVPPVPDPVELSEKSGGHRTPLRGPAFGMQLVGPHIVGYWIPARTTAVRCESERSTPPAEAAFVGTATRRNVTTVWNTTRPLGTLGEFTILISTAREVH